MISYVTGSIFTSPAKVLVNPVNTVGVMGKGLAKEFKALFPDMFNTYQRLCESGEFKVGKLWLFKTDNKWVLNFPTKTTWKQPSRIEYLEAGLENFCRSYFKQNITTIAFPKLGCGNGELDWDTQVKPLMEKYLTKIPISVFVYLDDAKTRYKPEHRDIENVERWLRSEPSFLSFQELISDLKRKIVVDRSSKLISEIKKEEFEVIFEGERDILLRSSKFNFKLSYEDLSDLWSHIRHYGFLTPQIAPSSISDGYDYVVSMLSVLPYLKLTNVADSYSGIGDNSKSLSLQLVPPANLQSTSLTESPSKMSIANAKA